MKRHHFYNSMCALVNGSPTKQNPARLLPPLVVHISRFNALSGFNTTEWGEPTLVKRLLTRVV